MSGGSSNNHLPARKQLAGPWQGRERLILRRVVKCGGGLSWALRGLVRMLGVAPMRSDIALAATEQRAFRYRRCRSAQSARSRASSAARRVTARYCEHTGARCRADVTAKASETGSASGALAQESNGIMTLPNISQPLAPLGYKRTSLKQGLQYCNRMIDNDYRESIRYR